MEGFRQLFCNLDRAISRTHVVEATDTRDCHEAVVGPGLNTRSNPTSSSQPYNVIVLIYRGKCTMCTRFTKYTKGTLVHRTSRGNHAGL